MPALGGVTVAARRRHSLEVEDEGHLKDFDVIFVFVKMFYTVCYSFNTKVLFKKHINGLEVLLLAACKL
jgi:hypothetical protein